MQDKAHHNRHLGFTRLVHKKVFSTEDMVLEVSEHIKKALAGSILRQDQHFNMRSFIDKLKALKICTDGQRC